MEVQQDDCLLQTSLAAGPTEEGSQISIAESAATKQVHCKIWLSEARLKAVRRHARTFRGHWRARLARNSNRPRCQRFVAGVQTWYLELRPYSWLGRRCVAKRHSIH
jgi:hypothetical protein